MNIRYYLLLLLLGLKLSLSAQFIEPKEFMSMVTMVSNSYPVSMLEYEKAIIRKAGSKLDFIVISYDEDGLPTQVDMPKNEHSPVALTYKYDYTPDDDMIPNRITVWMDGELSIDYRITLDEEGAPVEINVVLNKFKSYSKERYFMELNEDIPLTYNYEAYDESGELVISISDKFIFEEEDMLGYERYIDGELFKSYTTNPLGGIYMRVTEIKSTNPLDGTQSIEWRATYDDDGLMTHFFKPNPSDGKLVEYTISYE